MCACARPHSTQFGSLIISVIIRFFVLVLKTMFRRRVYFYPSFH